MEFTSPEHSLYSFEMLADSFIKAHAGDKKVQARKVDIFRIAQGESELLREFVTRFQKKRMLLLVVPDEWTAEEFTKGLNLRSSDTSRKLKESLLEFQKTWVDVNNHYESKIRIEDDQLSFPASIKGRDREKNKEKLKDDFDADRWSSRDRCRIKRRQVPETPPTPRLSEYNFNISVMELVSTIRNIKEARFPRLKRSDPSQRDPNIWYEYYGTNNHRIGDCQHLFEEIATLLKNGHFIEFLRDQAKNNYGLN
uniref:Retrotransposon gag domain-containing protein n=2 Tax=Nicotiana TaxID=4085 RepID=A0A1S4BC79_TOBAC|nr:PREDICTED: uncharacterized protein LOC104235365 [Nicotiana sylvestris]XP_016486472.1 PREDICTED: uncharacterized protein LOC107806753 [Nicotiana tabacum]